MFLHDYIGWFIIYKMKKVFIVIKKQTVKHWLTVKRIDS